MKLDSFNFHLEYTYTVIMIIPTAGNAIREHKCEKSRDKFWMFIIICIMKYIEITAFHLEGRNNRGYDKKP